MSSRNSAKKEKNLVNLRLYLIFSSHIHIKCPSNAQYHRKKPKKEDKKPPKEAFKDITFLLRYEYRSSPKKRSQSKKLRFFPHCLPSSHYEKSIIIINRLNYYFPIMFWEFLSDSQFNFYFFFGANEMADPIMAMMKMEIKIKMAIILKRKWWWFEWRKKGNFSLKYQFLFAL